MKWTGFIQTLDQTLEKDLKIALKNDFLGLRTLTSNFEYVKFHAFITYVSYNLCNQRHKLTKGIVQFLGGEKY